jgi:hypothetical protein
MHRCKRCPCIFSGAYTSFTSTLTVGEIPATLPSIAYNFPLTTDEEVWCLAVGMAAFVVQVLDPMSYGSFVVRMPDGEQEDERLGSPIAYNIQLTKLAVNAPLQ